MKKKLSAIVLACMMSCLSLIGLVGCGGRGGKQIKDFVMPENGFDTTKPVEITFYHTMGADLRKVLQDYIAAFNELYPNVKVVEDQIGKYEDVRDQIQTEINAKKQPDLAYCYPDHVALFNQANAVLPLNGFLPEIEGLEGYAGIGEYKDVTVTRADGKTEPIGFTQEQVNSFIPGYFMEGFQFGDESTMYTLPFSKSTEVLYYNKTFFEEHEIKVPTTWDEMETACAKIKALVPSCTPLGYDSEANWFITMCEQYGSPYTSSNGDHFLFDNQTNRDFVAKFQGWYNQGYFITQSINKNYTSNLFKAQTSYMCIGSSAGAKNQSPGRVDGEYPFEVGITSIPQVNPENPKVISQGPSICIFKQDDPQRVLASWLLAKYLTTSIGFQAQFSTVSGYVPVITTVMENPTYKNNIDNANGYDKVTSLAAKVCMEQASAYYTSPAFVGSSTARDEVGNLMQAVFTKSKSIDDAFKDAVEECEYFVS
ncbi:MAG: extracellular solute-binding protein [Clostridiales bacterium]|nr:extracellular solute-binding protein [Clostridiales bacterium]